MTNVLDRIASYLAGAPPESWMPDATDEEIMRIIYDRRGDEHKPAPGQIGMELKERGMLSDWKDGVMKYYSPELHRRLYKLNSFGYVLSFKNRFRLSDLGIGHVRKMEKESVLA
jgi:hypothetical protein